MIYRLVLPALLLCALPAGTAAQTPAPFRFELPAASPLVQGKPGKILVKVSGDLFRKGIAPETFGEGARRYGIYNVEPWINPQLLEYGAPAYKQSSGSEPSSASLRRILLVEYSASDRPEDVALAIGAIKGVEYAEPVYERRMLFTPNDTELNKQWYLDAIRAREAWDIDRADSTIVIAITDTGIERLHPDLKDAIWYNSGEAGEKRNNGIDDDGNGFVDDWWGYDFGGANGDTPDNEPAPGQENHGTLVAGIAAASGNNAEGIAGVAFGARLMSVKITNDQTRNELYREAEAIVYAAKMGADVINCSWGGEGAYRAEQEVIDAMIKEKDVVIVSAAGNRSREVDFYPASYRGVLSVASVTEGDARADFSNYGYRVDLAAPGNSIYSTTFSSAGGYSYDNGTSFSTPMASGAAALVRKRYPALTADQVREVLVSTTDDISAQLGSAYTGKMGTGRLNIREALASGPAQVAARLVSFQFIDAGGDGVADAGESIRLRADVQNVLAPTAEVSVSVAAISGPAVDIQSPGVNLGGMASLEVKSTPDGTIFFTVPAGTPDDSEIRFKVTVETAGHTTSQFVSLRVSPTYLTTDLNQIAVTFNSVGNIGYNGIDNDQGDGFLYNGSNYIYHGGLVIASDASHVADVIKESNARAGDGFRKSEPYRLVVDRDSTVETGTARFNDAHLDASRRVGVDVEMKTYEYRSQPDIVLVVYKIRNTGGARLDALRTGLYLDWDVSSTGFDDQAGYDAVNQMGYVRAPLDPSRRYVGTILLSPASPSFYAIDNTADGINTSFSPQRKWEMLSAGIHENQEITDMAIMLGAGPLALEPGQTTEVAYAMTVADDFQALRENAARARSLYQPGSVPAPRAAGAFAVTAIPNPFGGGTTISFVMPEAGHARIAVYDLQGRQVAVPFDGPLQAGAQQVLFGAEGLAEGIYFYELQAAGRSQRGTMVKTGR